MSGIMIILSLLSGVALFLFGMSLMGDGLKKVAGNKLEQILYKLTNRPIKGLLLGALVTAVIQSSSATSVMVVGFVNSGMMRVSQAISIIMGANIGTSITGWILCLSYIDESSGIATILSTATISAVVAIVGIILKMFVKKDVYRNVGEIMLGFAILMLGMQTMSSAVSPLKENATFIGMLTMFKNPFMGILAGIALTAILQSASASVGILQALAFSGSITFATAFPITMGIGVGAACPVLLSSIGSSKNGKRTAFAYLFNDTFGMIFWSILFYAVNAIVGGFPFLDMEMKPVTIAMLNSVFRIANICMLFPFAKWIEKLMFQLVKDSPEDEEEQADFDLLEARFLAYPPLAIAQSHMAMNGMIKKARKNIIRSMGLVNNFSDEKFNKIQEKETLINKYVDKIGTYLIQLIGKDLFPVQTKQISKFLHTISDIESLGDHAVNISMVAKEMEARNLTFSEEAGYEIDALMSAVREIVELTALAFSEDDIQVAGRIAPLHELVTIMCDELKSRHVERLQTGLCDIQQGIAFNDLITDLDRIAAHCSNVAVAMIELESSGYNSHQYLRSIRERKNEEYIAIFDSYAAKYNINGFKKKKKEQAKQEAERAAGQAENQTEKSGKKKKKKPKNL